MKGFRVQGEITKPVSFNCTPTQPEEYKRRNSMLERGEERRRTGTGGMLAQSVSIWEVRSSIAVSTCTTIRVMKLAVLGCSSE
jgi:hypothetical protein